MTIRHPLYKAVCILAVSLIVSNSVILAQEQVGSIRGIMYDKDFDVPLGGAEVTIAESGEKVTTSEEGNYFFPEVAPGTYTLIFSKTGYTRQIKLDVVVSAGQMTEVDIWLSGDYTEIDEFIVQDLQISSGTEAALLELRIKSPALMDSISSEYMSLSGASDAASALNLVAGTTVSEGKYAVVRGLPDRYVTSQMNGVRLPTADLDKRAVQLDQFPAAVIESIQVSKTFTPDQQGDASGGAVNVILKGIPDETTFKISGQYSYNTNVGRRDDFLTYKGGGVNCWADDTSRDFPPLITVFEDGELSTRRNFDDTIGVSLGDAPTDYKWSMSGGTNYKFDDFKIGGFLSFFYERDSSYHSNGINDKYMIPWPGGKFAPAMSNVDFDENEFNTSLYDVTKGSQEVKWGGLGTFGVEFENHQINVLYNFTRDATDQAILEEDTRGKAGLHKFWPELYDETYLNYDPFDPQHPGNKLPGIAPYRRNETLKYAERATDTLQFSGRHILSNPEWSFWDSISTLPPELDWLFAFSTASLDEPDKRLFATKWFPPEPDQGNFTGTHTGHRYTSSTGIGNSERIWKDVSEESRQLNSNLKMPFEQWNDQEGYLKFGVFYDDVTRDYNQTSYTNKTPPSWLGTWDEFYSSVYTTDSWIKTTVVDVDYDGSQRISAGYFMMDLPFNNKINLIGGLRFERTEIGIENFPDDNVRIISDDGNLTLFNPDFANVDFKQNDVLPSISFAYKPIEQIILRGAYSETIARQTFKELSPIRQREFLGDDEFSGNPNLNMSALKNYDLRFDWTPYTGGLVSLSYFYKTVKDPIEYVFLAGDVSDFIRPFNYPEGQLSGVEIEIRQKLDYFWDDFEGISAGLNATFIDSKVKLPKSDAANLKENGWPEPTRNMTNAPEYLYNIYMTYDFENIGGQLGIFYTVRGDTLIAGQSSIRKRYIPSVFETEFGTLNLSYSQKLGEIWSLKLQAKNLLDPKIQTVYRSEHIGDDVLKTSYTKGREFSISLSASF